MSNKVSAIQMTSSHSVKENLKIVDSLLKIAAVQESQLVVLPEMFPIIGLQETDRIDIAESLGHGLIQDFIANKAKEYNLWIVAGTMPIRSDDAKRVRATSLVFNHQGEIVARYDKIHLFDVTITQTEKYHESQTIEPGTEVVVVDTPVGKLGLSVCYDIRFPELYRRMFHLGAEIFAIPAAFTVRTGIAHWEVLTRSRAIENFCYVVGAGQTGTHSNGRKTYGHSLIINPWGEVVASLANTIGVITHEVDLDFLHKIRNDMPVADHRRIFDLS